MPVFFRGARQKNRRQRYPGIAETEDDAIDLVAYPSRHDVGMGGDGRRQQVATFALHLAERYELGDQRLHQRDQRSYGGPTSRYRKTPVVALFGSAAWRASVRCRWRGSTISSIVSLDGHIRILDDLSKATDFRGHELAEIRWRLRGADLDALRHLAEGIGGRCDLQIGRVRRLTMSGGVAAGTTSPVHKARS